MLVLTDHTADEHPFAARAYEKVAAIKAERRARFALHRAHRFHIAFRRRPASLVVYLVLGLLLAILLQSLTVWLFGLG